MAMVTGDLLSTLLTTWRGMFVDDFLAASNMQGWRNLAIVIDSQNESEGYTWFGTVPKMEDVTHGTVKISDIPGYSFTLPNLEFQTAMEVERVLIERDRLNLVKPRINQLAMEAARHPGELMLSILPTNPNAYDGAALIGDSRIIGASGNIDNQVTGTGTTVAQFQADLASARAQMARFQDDQGRVMRLMPNTIMIPPEMEQVVWQALNVQQGQLVNPVLPGANGGFYSAAGYNIISNPFLTDVNNWYLLHVGAGTDKPFIFQSEKVPELLGATDPNTEYVITRRKFLYSVYGRYNVGITDPRYVVLVTNT